MITGKDIIGCAPVIVVAFADCTAKSTPKKTGMLTPTKNIKRNEDSRRHIALDLRIEYAYAASPYPIQTQATRTSIWMLASSP